MKKHKFKIEITETLQRIVTVEASSVLEALNEVEKKYANEEIVLDSNDFVCKDIHLFNEKEE